MLLKDDQIETLIHNTAGPLLTNYDEPKDWRDRRSLIQPSSLDLHVGNILVPGAQFDHLGSNQRPRESHVLAPGETVVVITREWITMPPDLAAFGFPPTSISNRAVLMTNPGHVDPGYHGNLRFTLINMGREPYEIRSGDTVVTLLLVKLSGNATSDYAKRNPAVPNTLSLEEDVNRLANDFLDVTKRAKRIANRAILRASFWSVVIAAIVTVLAQLLQPGWKDEVNELKARVDVLSSERSAATLATRIQRIEKAFCEQARLQSQSTRRPAMCA